MSHDLIPDDAPRELREFLSYMFNAKGASTGTVREYYLDLRTFYRYLKCVKGLVPQDIAFSDITLDGISTADLAAVTTSDLYDYLLFEGTQRPVHHKSALTEYGIDSAARARKVASLRSFYKYLTVKRGYFDKNPAEDLESPKRQKSLPKYLSKEECLALLETVDGQFRERDYCILILFLNLGLRVSELVGLDLSDIGDESIRILGKGNKERVLFLNDACRFAIDNYLPHRLSPEGAMDGNALFISRQHNRINVQTVKWLVKKYLSEAGLSAKGCSAHKLRHSAATLMLQNGVDVRTLQEVLGHEQLGTTMIYTHITDRSIQDAIRSNPLSQVRPSEPDNSENTAFDDKEPSP